MNIHRKWQKGVAILIPALAILFVGAGIDEGLAKENAPAGPIPQPMKVIKGDLGIVITDAPLSGGGASSRGIIKGRASGGDPRQTRVVIYSHTDRWYVQPYDVRPYTTIRSNGVWAKTIHLGETYAALLVKRSYIPPPTLDVLPPVGEYVLAVTTAAASERNVVFSGYEWGVKSSDAPVGPGPNLFSNSRKNVWTDSQGRLHLRIIRQKNQWYCSEAVLANSLGYGTYRFYIDRRLDNLPPSAVLGLFTWSDAAEQAHREIDIEFSRWGDANNQSAQYVIQPYDTPGNMTRFDMPARLKTSTHSFLWEPGRVSFLSLKGRKIQDYTVADKIFEWTTSQGIPQPGDETARINLWLFDANRDGVGDPPSNRRNIEVVIRKFEFIPWTSPCTANAEPDSGKMPRIGG